MINNDILMFNVLDFLPYLQHLFSSPKVDKTDEETENLFFLTR